MPKQVYISKTLIKKVVTFLNKYIDDPHIVCGYTKYSDNISVSIQIWDLSNCILGRNIYSFSVNIDSKTDLDLIKRQIKENIDKNLEQLKRNQIDENIVNKTFNELEL